jgi:hypothetical protein
MKEIGDSLDGCLPAEKATLHLVPACLNFFIRSIILINDDITEVVTAELWIKRKGSTSSRRIIPQWAFSKDAQELTFIPLRPGDTIEGKASIANRIHYLIGYVRQMET